MAKSSKKSKVAALADPSPAASTSAAPSDGSFEVSGKAPTAKPAPPAAKATRKPRAVAARKRALSTKPRKPPVKRKPAPAQVAVSDDEIRLRAYFIGERRNREGIARDSSNDWLEARRQLMEEAAGRA